MKGYKMASRPSKSRLRCEKPPNMSPTWPAASAADPRLEVGGGVRALAIGFAYGPEDRGKAWRSKRASLALHPQGRGPIYPLRGAGRGPSCLRVL